MMITILAILLMVLAYFLVLYGAVGFIQDKRFFGSAPKENLVAIPDKKERFCGAHLIGWGIEVIAVLLFAGAAVLVEIAHGQIAKMLGNLYALVSGRAVAAVRLQGGGAIFKDR